MSKAAVIAYEEAHSLFVYLGVPAAQLYRGVVYPKSQHGSVKALTPRLSQTRRRMTMILHRTRMKLIYGRLSKTSISPQNAKKMAS